MTASAPLQGRVVIDLTTALAGPYATLLLGGLGARVIKVENPHRGGDSSRTNSPYVTASGLSPVKTGDEDMSVSMLLRGRNKESISLDLKTSEGRDVLLDLIRQADVLVENFSAGVTRRLGIDYESVREVNPRLIYTSITGFGSDETGGAKAMDTIVQALSGVMMTAGDPGDSPVRFGLPIADLSAPLFAVIGTVSALLEATQSGEGQHVDVSMLGAMTSLVACEPFDAFEEMGYPTRTGDYVPRLAPFGTFRAADGWFAVCGPTDAFAAGVFRAIEEPELADDPRFSRRDARVSNSDDLHQRMSDWAAGQTVAEAMAAFEVNGVPAAPVRSLADAVRDPRVQARGEVVRIQHPAYDVDAELWGTGVPITFSRSEVGLDRPAHPLGADTEQVLRELLGYQGEQIAVLADAKAI
ncbi:CaiB/BaiF CoA transferase family protein [Microbacterium oxydans]|uniref:CaiB/BaiF CoA transferase family protein n=1 Tax=Microbacterium oxydans TaxID=82380 RepID=UPI001E42EB70|nr:CoA transferase [Microbacterium oxydans]